LITAFHITEQIGVEMISEIRLATVGVADLAAAERFYAGVFDYVVHDRGTVGGPAFKELWLMPEGLGGEVLVMAPEGATSGFLRLVQWDQPGELYWGDYSRMQDYGHYALNMRVPDIEAYVEALETYGGRRRSGPHYWTVNESLSAWDSLSYDPDGNLVDAFQLEPGPGSVFEGYDGRPSNIQTIAVHSSDAKRTAMFYAALGFRPLYDKLLVDMEHFFNLPQGTNLHNINMMMPSAPEIGRLEIAQYVGWPGESQRDRAVPPALGILGAAFETDDLDATEALLKSIGAEPAGERVELEVPGPGAVVARSYFGPDDELLEFYQRR
jgi:catechol 2,3-dioxygenase-like lactoylglutathione lyase family enzyme